MSAPPPPPHDITIRALREADLDAAAHLAAQLVRLHHALDARRFLYAEPLEPGYARFLRSELADPKAALLVAEAEGGAVVGYVYGRLEPRDWMALREACGELHDVYVDDAERGRGIGAALVMALVAALEALGAPRVILSTAWQNGPAQEMFAKLGFRPTMIEMTRERGG